MRRSFFLPVAAASLVLTACVRTNIASPSPRSSGSAADELVIGQARVAQNRAIADQDPDRVAIFWTEDVTIRRGLGQPLSGRAAYRQLFVPSGNRDSTLIYQRETTAIDVSPHWPLAFETGTWAGHLGSATGPTLISGSYSAQWVKRGAVWLIRSEVFVALNCAGIGCSYAALP